MTDLIETLQRLYDSEINGHITWVWDGGFEWAVDAGSEVFGGNAPTVAQAIEHLAVAAVEHYPQSEFATWRKAR